MKNCFRHLLHAALCCLTTASLSTALADADTRPLVLSSLYPLELIARDIAGDHVEHQVLLPAGQEPHHVSLTFSQRRALAQADLLLWTGPSLESHLAKVVATRHPDSVMALEEISAGTSRDPHFWLDPATAQAFGAALGRKLALQHPQLADDVDARQVAFARDLDDTLAILRTRLSPYRDRRFVSEHDAYSHFTQAMGLRSAGSLSDSSDVDIGARSLAELTEARGIDCVVVEQLPGRKRARQLAQRLDVPVVAIDPLGSGVAAHAGYSGLLESFAAGFERCFKAGK